MSSSSRELQPYEQEEIVIALIMIIGCAKIKLQSDWTRRTRIPQIESRTITSGLTLPDIITK